MGIGRNVIQAHATEYTRVCTLVTFILSLWSTFNIKKYLNALDTTLH